MSLQNRVNLNKLSYRLLIAGVFVLASFQLGIYYYATGKMPDDTKITTRRLEDKISPLFSSGLTISIEDRIIKLKGSEIKDFTEEYDRNYSKLKDVILKLTPGKFWS